MKQNNITKAYDKDGNMVDFQRWSYKSANICKRNHLNLLKDYGNVFKVDIIDKLICYSTPDGVTEHHIAWELSHDEIINALEA